MTIILTHDLAVGVMPTCIHIFFDETSETMINGQKLKLIEAPFEIIRRDNMFAATATQMYDNDKLNALFL